MQELVITDFDDAPIGAIWISADGEVQCEVHDKSLSAQLDGLVQRITAQPIPLRTGKQIQKQDGTQGFITQMKRCTPGDPDFLNAVRDLVNKTHWEGRRLYGHLSTRREAKVG